VEEESENPAVDDDEEEDELTSTGDVQFTPTHSTEHRHAYSPVVEFVRQVPPLSQGPIQH
jgi:hypothetical protein